MIRATPEQADQFSRLYGSQAHAYVKAAIEDARNLLESTGCSAETTTVVRGQLLALRGFLQLIESGKRA